jgi:hypothetical protein
MPTIGTPTEALKAKLATRRQQGPDPVTPAPLEQIAQGPMGQRFTFAGAPDDGRRRSPASEGGAQAKANEPTRPTLDLPRVQTDIERPERNTERRNLQRLVSGLGALGAVAGAAGDSTLMTAVGAGLAQGAGQAQKRSEQRYQQRLSSYEQFVRGARTANRQRRRAEAEAEYEAALQDYELDRQRQQSEREFQREMEMARLESELDQPSETEKGVSRARQDYYQAGAEKRRAGARENRQEAEAAAALAEKRQRTGGEEGEDRTSVDELNRQLVETGRALSTTATQLEAAQEELGETSLVNAKKPLQNRIVRLQETFDELQREQARIHGQLNAARDNEEKTTYPSTSPPQTGGSPSSESTSPSTAPSERGRKQGRQEGGGQQATDRINQLARQQAPQVDTVTQADIGAAVETYGEGAPQVRLLRRIRQIQQGQ